MRSEETLRQPQPLDSANAISLASPGDPGESASSVPSHLPESGGLGAPRGRQVAPCSGGAGPCRTLRDLCSPPRPPYSLKSWLGPPGVCRLSVREAEPALRAAAPPARAGPGLEAVELGCGVRAGVSPTRPAARTPESHPCPCPQGPPSRPRIFPATPSQSSDVIGLPACLPGRRGCPRGCAWNRVRVSDPAQAASHSSPLLSPGSPFPHLRQETGWQRG